MLMTTGAPTSAASAAVRRYNLTNKIRTVVLDHRGRVDKTKRITMNEALFLNTIPKTFLNARNLVL